MRIYAIFLLFIVSQQMALACAIQVLTVEETINSSRAIYIGRVTGVHVPMLESQDSKNYGLGRVNRNVRVVVYETLRGKEKQLLEFEAHWCGGGAWDAELGKNVIVYLDSNDNWYLQSADDKILVLLVCT